MADVLPIIFTDLDGTLLDHFDYSFAPAKPLIKKLKAAGIPIILNSSKTAVEIVKLNKKLKNKSPFIAENGGVIQLPDDYFAEVPAGFEQIDKSSVLLSGYSREYWLKELVSLQQKYPDQFSWFDALGAQGIADVTGLPKKSAKLANQRQVSEPVYWYGNEAGKQEFIADIEAAGGVVQQGGRFLTVGSWFDKGEALQKVVTYFQQQQPSKKIVTLALGDSNNDIAMLQTADYAAVVKSPTKPSLELNLSNAYFTEDIGPKGWVEAVRWWLTTLHISL